MTEKRVTVDEIVGIVKTDEQTNSVQLKKEAQLSICEKRVLELEKENEQLRKDATTLIYSNQDYRRENEKLKQQLRIYSDGLKVEIRETKEVFEDYSECVDEKLELKKENEKLRKAVDEADDLIKSHLSSHYNRKWENILEYFGVDLE